MTSIGVPVYDGLMVMENNAIPYEFGNMGNLNVKTSSTSGMGNMFYYELTYGHFTDRAVLTNILNGILSGYDIAAIGSLIAAIVEAIYTGVSVSVAVGNVLIGLVSHEKESAILSAILAA